MNVIETRANLGKSYGQTRALHECNLAIPDRHVVALVGPNGAGKTTLLNLTVGLALPTAGEITVLGGHRPPVRSPHSMASPSLPRTLPLYRNLSAADLIHETRNLNRRFDQRYANQRLDELAIPLQRKAGTLSGGQQAQLALTLALARWPQLLVLDEPMATLDPIAQRGFHGDGDAGRRRERRLGRAVVARTRRARAGRRLPRRRRTAASKWPARSRSSSPLIACSPARRPGPSSPRGSGASSMDDRRIPGASARANREPFRAGATRMGGPRRDARRADDGVLTGAGHCRVSRLGERVGRGTGGDAMTSLAPTIAPAEDMRLRPLPWRRTLWVTWRHHRVALGGVAVFLGVLAVWLWTTGLLVHHAFAAAVSCRPVGSANCTNLVIDFESTNSFLKGGFVLQPIPVLIGAFIGPVVLAREFETGTFRYAWTQAFGRWRWALAKLVLLGIAVASFAAAFSLLLSWYYQPYVSAQNAPNAAGASPFSAGLFDLRGPAFVGWTLAAFAIGALAGMLIRRIVPAIVATLAAYTAFALLTANVLREHYLTPLVAKNLHIPNSAWILSEWWTKGGKYVFGSRIQLDVLPQLCPSSFTAGPLGGVSSSGPMTATQCLMRHGYVEWATYQPISRFWPFQWIEGGCLLARRRCSSPRRSGSSDGGRRDHQCVSIVSGARPAPSMASITTTVSGWVTMCGNIEPRDGAHQLDQGPPVASKGLLTRFGPSQVFRPPLTPMTFGPRPAHVTEMPCKTSWHRVSEPSERGVKSPDGGGEGVEHDDLQEDPGDPAAIEPGLEGSRLCGIYEYVLEKVDERVERPEPPPGNAA